MKLETVLIEHAGFPNGLSINESNYDPKKHRLYGEPDGDSDEKSDAPAEKSGFTIEEAESLPYDELRAQAKLFGITGNGKGVIIDKLKAAGHIS